MKHRFAFLPVKTVDCGLVWLTTYQIAHGKRYGDMANFYVRDWITGEWHQPQEWMNNS